MLSMSRLRRVVLLQLAKAWKLDLPVPIGRLVKVFGLNSGLVYRFLRELAREGLVVEEARGSWRLNDVGKALAEYALGSIHEGTYEYWIRMVPEVYYYIAEPPSIEWLGFQEKVLVIADNALKGRIEPPKNYSVVYKSMRGRRWRYDWDLGASKGFAEQSLADLLSYDPAYPAEQYILYNLDRLDLDDIARRTALNGLRRLATFLAFFRLSSGKLVPTRFNYLRLADLELLEKRLGEYAELVYANGIAERRGI